MKPEEKYEWARAALAFLAAPFIMPSLSYFFAPEEYVRGVLGVGLAALAILFVVYLWILFLRLAYLAGGRAKDAD